jgi:hypothetical protein
MPSDFDWIFKRDPYWRERPKEEALATDAREPRTSPRREIGSRPTPHPRKAEPAPRVTAS